MYYPVTKPRPAGKVAKGGHFIFAIGGNLYRRTEDGFVMVCSTLRPKQWFSKKVKVLPEWAVYEVDPVKYASSWLWTYWEFEGWRYRS